MKHLNLIFVFFIFNLKDALVQEMCDLKLKYPEVETPLFVSPTAPSSSTIQSPLMEATDESFFLFPTPDGKTKQRVSIEEPQIIACPGKGNYFVGTRQKTTNITKELQCKNDKPYTDTGLLATAQKIKCKKRPTGSIVHTKNKCHGNGIFKIVGWKITDTWFLPQLTICWDSVLESPIYVKHIIYGQFLNKRVASPGRPSFKPGKLYSEKIYYLFKMKSQRNFYKNVLKKELPTLGTRRFYFARGHLAPDGDFVLPAEQDATYFYANTVPQFQKFNNGNWKVLEGNVRKLAEGRNTSITVVTGVYEILMLETEDRTTSSVNIYLYPEKKLYPAPRVMWKVVHDPLRNEAVAILGLNLIIKDAEKLNAFNLLCNDICPSLLWGSWTKISDWQQGPLICCTYEQFQNLILISLGFDNVNLLSEI